MYMTIQQILREKNLSRYQLSKKSGVPWATLADICSGKTTLSRCSAGTLMKLSSTLDIPMEQLITLTVEKPQMHGGKPTDRTYLEKNLPASLDKALREYIQGEKDKVSYPAGWLEHSYVACCGTSIQPVLERLRQNPKLDTVYLCLDNDEAGEDACDGMLDTLEDMGYDVERLRPEGKDWNDDLRAKRGKAKTPTA